MIIKNGKTISYVIKGGKAIDKILRGSSTIYQILENYLAVGTIPLKLFNPKEEKVVDYKIFGNSAQQNNNLLPKSYASGTRTIYGIDYTVNSDGSITLNGTATKGNSDYMLINSSNPIIFKAGTYTISGNPIASGVRIWFRSVDDSSNLVSCYNGAKGTITLAEDTNMYCYISVNAGVVIDNVTMYPQIEYSNVATEFVSPFISSENPIEIESVGEYDETTSKYKIPVVVRGKNLFNYNLADNTSSSELANCTLIEELENGVILQGKEGSSPGTNNFGCGWYEPTYGAFKDDNAVKLKKGDMVTISADYTLLTKNYTGNMSIYLYGGANHNGTAFTAPELNVKTRVSQRYSIKEDGMYYPLFTINSHKIKIENIMIEKSMTPTEYEDYAEPATTNIYLDEPLRKRGGYTDYIDFKNQKLVRNVKVLDDTGTLLLEESLSGLEKSIEETIELPDISIVKGTKILELDENIQASNMQVIYKRK